MPNINNNNNNNRMQGVLWKRRDVFKNRWRPRWFVLHPEQHMLTYYLLQNDHPPVNTSNFSTMSSTRSIASSSSTGGNHSHNNNNNNNNNRRRTFSEVSNVSENAMDYDVVPRGTIYLLGGCTVEANEVLTRPDEELYAITITNQETATSCHLAARTPDVRQKWIEQIRPVCNQQGITTSASISTSISASISATATATARTSQGATSSSAATPPTARSLESRLAVAALPELEPPRPATTTSTTATVDDSSTASEPLSEPSSSVPSLSSAPSLTSPWKTIPNPKLSENVPSDLVTQMEELLEIYLPLAFDKSHPEWVFKYETDGIHCSSHCEQNMIRSIRTTKHHHPAEYLQLLWDLERLLEFETNVSSQKRLHIYNPHTLLVHTAYNPVWPTAPRDFASAVHWRLLEHAETKDTAVCLLAVSCDHAAALQPSPPGHVRGTLRVSFNVWKPFVEMDGTTTGCVHTRLISYDLNGNIPKAIVSTIMEKQAVLPRIMDLHLQNTKTTSASEFFQQGKQLDYASIYKALEDASPPPPPKNTADDANDTRINNSTRKPSLDHVDSIVTSTTKSIQPSSSMMNETPPPIILWQECVALLVPLVLHQLLSTLFPRRSVSLVVFCLASALGIRWVFLQHLLQHCYVAPKEQEHRSSSEHTSESSGTTCCRFTVDLNSKGGILQYLSKAQATKKQLGRQEEEATELLVTHIVLRALARAMAEHPELTTRRLLPGLLPSLYSMDLVLHGDNRNTPPCPAWIPHANQQSIPDIARYLESMPVPPPNIWQQYFLGPSCRLWTTPISNDDDASSDLECVLVTDDCPIAVVISGILRLDQNQPANNINIDANHLSTSITIRSPNAEACRSFAEQVQRLIKSPELCDE